MLGIKPCLDDRHLTFIGFLISNAVSLYSFISIPMLLLQASQSAWGIRAPERYVWNADRTRAYEEHAAKRRFRLVCLSIVEMAMARGWMRARGVWRGYGGGGGSVCSGGVRRWEWLERGF